MKDAPAGAWTPPALVVELFGVSVASTDEAGLELDLRALWKTTNKKKTEVRMGRHGESLCVCFPLCVSAQTCRAR
jgi:hypothetical protein